MSGTGWRTRVHLSALRERSTLLREIRAFFEARQVMEVTTPVLGAFGVPDTHLQNMAVQLTGGRNRGYLQTSPEYAMKRLVASGSGAIYQICPAFRGGESGVRHNPEFTMLEWYRPGFTLQSLIDETVTLLTTLKVIREPTVYRYGELFESTFGLDPHAARLSDLESLVAGLDLQAGHLEVHDDDGYRADLLDLLFSSQVEPSLTAAVVVEFPSCQIALASSGTDLNGREIARRFEVFVHGMELANGYDELTDSAELEKRLHLQNRMRRTRNLPEMEVDFRLIAANANLGTCAGVAMGVDRLVMLRSGVSSLDQVVNFRDDLTV